MEVGQDWGAVVGLGCRAVGKTVDRGTMLGLGHGAMEETVEEATEDQVAIAEPPALEATRPALVQ